MTERKSRKHVASEGRGKNQDGRWVGKVRALKVSGEQDQEQGRCDGGRSGGVGQLLRTG